MRKIAILNFKGGTGKTTTAVNLGHALSLKGFKVLIIDCDAQGSIAGWFGIDPELTLFDLLSNKAKLSDCIIPVRDNLDSIVSDKYLTRIESILIKGKNPEKVFSNKLKNLKGYDYIILDCPPALSLINLNILEYVKEIFIPVNMEYLTLRGIKQVLELIPENIQYKIIPTFYDQRTRKSKEILNDLKDYFKDLVTEPIRVNVRLSESASYHKTIFEYDSSSRGAVDYKLLGKEIIK